MPDLIFNYLKQSGFINENENITATNLMEIRNNEVVISGNKQGLILLAEYFVAAAISNANEDHIHLDELNFFDKTNGQLIICKESGNL
jgi:hypothetical protein